jgi:hypothetical protein
LLEFQARERKQHADALAIHERDSAREQQHDGERKNFFM